MPEKDYFDTFPSFLNLLKIVFIYNDWLTLNFRLLVESAICKMLSFIPVIYNKLSE